MLCDKDRFFKTLPTGEKISYEFWRKYDDGYAEPPEPTVVTQTVYIKPDYSSIKSAIDSFANRQISTLTNEVLALKDYRLGFSYSDYELKQYIKQCSYSDLTTHFSNYYNGMNLNYSPFLDVTYNSSINSDNDMLGYISNLSNNCSSQINKISSYGQAFIKSYNNKYRYLQSMKATELKSFLAYCVSTDSSMLDKCIFIYKDLIGTNMKIYLPDTYVESAFRDCKKFSGNTWYSVSNGQLEVLECITYSRPRNINNITIK